MGFGKRFQSTIGWMHEGATREGYEEILEKFEEEYPINTAKVEIDYDAEPVHILCLDGGGMRGYALAAVSEAISEFCPDGKNFFRQFDLIGGSSVGGAGGLIMNSVLQLPECSVADACAVERNCLDTIRTESFSHIKVTNALNIFQTGSLIPKEHQIITVLEKKYGKDLPLKNDGVPSFAFSANKVIDPNATGNKEDIEPFILRTYDYPKTNQFDGYSGTSSCTMVEAMAATSCQPPALDRVKIEVDGETKNLCDGVVLCTCPLPIAIEEAMKLYPTRPLGVILSLGFMSDESDFIYRTIETTRLVHPQLHFQRIAPTKIMESFSVIESDIDDIAIMEQQVKDYVRNTPRVKNALKVTIEKLFEEDKDRNLTSQDLTLQTQSSMSQLKNCLRQSVALSSFNPYENAREQVTKFLKSRRNFYANYKGHSSVERLDLKNRFVKTKSTRFSPIDKSHKNSSSLKRRLFKSVYKTDAGNDDTKYSFSSIDESENEEEDTSKGKSRKFKFYYFLLGAFIVSFALLILRLLFGVDYIYPEGYDKVDLIGKMALAVVVLTIFASLQNNARLSKLMMNITGGIVGLVIHLTVFSLLSE